MKSLIKWTALVVVLSLSTTVHSASSTATSGTTSTTGISGETGVTGTSTSNSGSSINITPNQTSGAHTIINNPSRTNQNLPVRTTPSSGSTNTSESYPAYNQYPAPQTSNNPYYPQQNQNYRQQIRSMNRTNSSFEYPVSQQQYYNPSPINSSNYQQGNNPNYRQQIRSNNPNYSNFNQTQVQQSQGNSYPPYPVRNTISDSTNPSSPDQNPNLQKRDLEQNNSNGIKPGQASNQNFRSHSNLADDSGGQEDPTLPSWDQKQQDPDFNQDAIYKKSQKNANQSSNQSDRSSQNNNVADDSDGSNDPSAPSWKQKHSEEEKADTKQTSYQNYRSQIRNAQRNIADNSTNQKQTAPVAPDSSPDPTLPTWKQKHKLDENNNKQSSNQGYRAQIRAARYVADNSSNQKQTAPTAPESSPDPTLPSWKQQHTTDVKATKQSTHTNQPKNTNSSTKKPGPVAPETSPDPTLPTWKQNHGTDENGFKQSSNQSYQRDIRPIADNSSNQRQSPQVAPDSNPDPTLPTWKQKHSLDQDNSKQSSNQNYRREIRSIADNSSNQRQSPQVAPDSNPDPTLPTWKQKHSVDEDNSKQSSNNDYRSQVIEVRALADNSSNQRQAPQVAPDSNPDPTLPTWKQKHDLDDKSDTKQSANQKYRNQVPVVDKCFSHGYRIKMRHLADNSTNSKEMAPELNKKPKSNSTTPEQSNKNESIQVRYLSDNKSDQDLNWQKQQLPKKSDQPTATQSYQPSNTRGHSFGPNTAFLSIPALDNGTTSVQVNSNASPTSQLPAQIDSNHPASYFNKEKRNLLEVAKDNPNLSTFVSALEASGLATQIQTEGPYTIFAPSNEAFKQLPRGALERLLKPENQRQLYAIIAYHIVSGKIPAKDVTTSKVRTLGGKDINVEVTRGNITVDDAEVIRQDLPASNGIIHIIDEVMLPN